MFDLVAKHKRVAQVILFLLMVGTNKLVQRVLRRVGE